MYATKDLLQLKTNIKIKIVCVLIILYILSHKGLYLYISMMTITTFPGTSLVPEWKLGGIGKRVFPLVLFLYILDLTKVRQDLPLPDSQIGALEPSLCGTIIHVTFTLLIYLKRIC